VAAINPTVEREIGELSSAINRISSLYQNWAQENGALYGVVQVLYVLYFYDAVTQKQISDICEIPKQTVNNAIRQFRKDNYIIIASSDKDKRRKEISLTEIGKEYAEKTLEPFFKLNENVFGRVETKLVRELVKSLAAFGNAMEMEMELIRVSAKWESSNRL
jgi:DNA-binding MarR family transcriptional regulator